MNDTPQGDGNVNSFCSIKYNNICIIRMNDTPQGDGNLDFCIMMSNSLVFK